MAGCCSAPKCTAHGQHGLPGEQASWVSKVGYAGIPAAQASPAWSVVTQPARQRPVGKAGLVG